jgi:hypothetical protein
MSYLCWVPAQVIMSEIDEMIQMLQEYKSSGDPV